MKDKAPGLLDEFVLRKAVCSVVLKKEKEREKKKNCYLNSVPLFSVFIIIKKR